VEDKLKDKPDDTLEGELADKAEDSSDTGRQRRVDREKISDLAEKLAAAVPDDLQDLRADLEHNFQGLLAVGLEKMNLVNREEFDVQSKVLARTREKLERLEQELQALQRDTNSDDS